MSERIKEIYKGMMLNNAIGICLDGSSWHGWLFAKHPDGQWVSLCKIDMWQALTSKEAELQAEREKVSRYNLAVKAIHDINDVVEFQKGAVKEAEQMDSYLIIAG